MGTDTRKILVVDDEPSICDILEKYLVKKGYEVARSQDGNTALEIIRNDSIDLVVSDIKMPGISGVELLQKIRENKRMLPVLITTGFPTLDTAIEALKAGAYDYLTKPFHLEEIGEKIRRALAQRQLEEENILFSKLVSLHEVTKILSSTRESSELNAKFLDFSVRLSKADGGSLIFAESKTKLSLAGSRGQGLSPESWVKQPFVLAAKWVIEHHEPLVIEEGTELPAGLKPIPAEFHSYVSFPLKNSAKTIGVLNLARKAGKESFSNLDLELITVLASQASIAIDNVRLDSAIRDNYIKTIRAFAVAVEVKDEYTRGHSEKVKDFAVNIARHLNLPPHDIEFVKYAGLLHDIGKIGISEYILTKPGKLTPQEFLEIKKHPELGARIIEDVPFLKTLAPMVLHHHEFFDGGGYPSGIAGETIPLGARILSVADAFDAMTSNRPYRKSMSQEVAIQILETQKNSQFDPAIVDCFIDILQSEQPS